MQREREKQMLKGKTAMANAGNDPFAAHAALLNADGMLCIVLYRQQVGYQDYIRFGMGQTVVK